MEGVRVPRVTEYGSPPQFETVQEIDAALRTLDWLAQQIGYGLNRDYVLQHVSTEFRDQLARRIDSPIDAAGRSRGLRGPEGAS